MEIVRSGSVKVGEMLVNCSLSPVTREQWEQEGARVSKLQELIPDREEVLSVSLHELKTLGGNAIVMTCPLGPSTLTSDLAGSSCETNREKTVTLPTILKIGETTVEEIVVCVKSQIPGSGRATEEDIDHALTYRPPARDAGLWPWGAWT